MQIVLHFLIRVNSAILCYPYKLIALHLHVLKQMQQQVSNIPEKTRNRIRRLWIAFIGSLLLFILLVIGIENGMVGHMPSLAELENPQSATSTEVLASDGTVIGRYFFQDRSNSKYSEISPFIFNALLATEDARFFDHAGIDPVATVAIPFYVLMNKKRGSSTLTQQLAKNLFPRSSGSKLTLPFMKLKEWVLAVKLERNLTKQEIITLYLNTVPFGDNVYGIKNASLTFYNKTPDKVTVDEAAVLIGMLKGNTIYNPRTRPKRARERRNVVLEQMAKYNYITEAQLAELKNKETPLDYHKIDYHDGLAPYFRQVLEQYVKQACKDLKKSDGSPYDIYKDGLKIYTTIDLRMQRYAEEAVQQHLTNLQKQFMAQPGYVDGKVWERKGNVQNILKTAIKSSDRYQYLRNQDMTEQQAIAEMNKPVKMRVFAWNQSRYKDTVMSPIDSIKYMKLFLQAGFMAMDPYTGEVKAWVGGIEHKFFMYDHVNVNTKRQVGSTIKPLLYSFAVNNGFSPCGTLSTAPQEFPTLEKPYDAGGSDEGDITMQRALAKSINNAALYILKQVGIEPFIDFAHKCGINSRMDAVPSIALGVSDISLFEMLGAYTMFPAGGMHTEPYFIVKIEDKNGALLKTFAAKQKELINKNSAFKMVKMMRGVMNAGTGGRMRYRYGVYNDMAGKTGTTNNQADAWFIGYTPQLLAGSWVGCDDREFRFRNEQLGQGAAAALPIVAYFMKKLNDDPKTGIDPKVSFIPPDGFDDCTADTVVTESLDPNTDLEEYLPPVPNDQ